MTVTTNLEMPYLEQNVAQPEVPENEVKDIVDAAICGIYTIPMLDGNFTLDDLSLTDTASYPRKWQYGILVISNPHTAETTLTLEDDKKMIYIIDNTTGWNIIFKTASEPTGVDIPDGVVYQVYSDGSNIKRVEV